MLQKNAKFSSAGGSAPRLLCLRRLGAWPQDPPLQISGYAPEHATIIENIFAQYESVYYKMKKRT